MHFKSPEGSWINVEIWGDLPDNLSKGRYKETRALKEAFLASDPNALGIQFQDCYSDSRLTEILKPYIGVIEPFRFDNRLKSSKKRSGYTPQFASAACWRKYGSRRKSHQCEGLIIQVGTTLVGPRGCDFRISTAAGGCAGLFGRA